jgi:hypothetical protein
MWNWFNCYLSGRHDYGVWCEPGAIFLRCVHCGRRSSGWTVGSETASTAKAAHAAAASSDRTPRVVPFRRAAAS